MRRKEGKRMKKVGVAIMGLGVVGGGVYDILTDKKEYFKKTQDLDITVETVLEKNIERALAHGVEKDRIAANIEEIVSNPNVDIVTEMTNLIDAQRGYEANATAFNSSKNLMSQGLSIAQG